MSSFFLRELENLLLDASLLTIRHKSETIYHDFISLMFFVNDYEEEDDGEYVAPTSPLILSQMETITTKFLKH